MHISGSLCGIRNPFIQHRGYRRHEAVCDSRRRSRLKDFVDIACLSTRIPFYEMLKCYERKFPQANVIRPFKALTYFDDIDFGEDIVMLNFEYDWKQIARRLKEMTVRQEHIFSQWPLKEQKRPVAEDKDMTSMKRGRKR